MGFFSNLFGRKPAQQTDAKAPAASAPTPQPEPEPETPPWKELSPEECASRIQAGGVVVLDVRMPQEHVTRRIEGSVLIPVQQLRQRMGELDKNATYIVHCEHGMRSTDACYFLGMAGFKNLYEMSGGLSMYSGPTTRGPIK